MLPAGFKKYFWDCDFSALRWEQYSVFISERLLNFGNADAISWLRKQLSDSEIFRIIQNSSCIDAKTKNYWNTVLG